MAVCILLSKKRVSLFLSLLSQQFLEVFRRERAAFGASIHHRSTSPPPPPLRLLYLWVIHFKPGPRWLSPGRGGERGTVVRWQKCRRKVDVAVGFHFDVDGQTCVASRIFFEEREREGAVTLSIHGIVRPRRF